MIDTTDRIVKVSFGRSRTNALHAGAAWHLTIDEYWLLWEPHWVGRKQRRLGLQRYSKDKPFQYGNVYIGTRSGSLRNGFGVSYLGSLRL